MRTGQPEVIEDTRKEQDRVNPSSFWRGIASAVGLPVSIEGKQIGVMWVHYSKPRRFSRHEIDSLQLYVNQASLTLKKAWLLKDLLKARNTAKVIANISTLEDLDATLRSVAEGTLYVLNCDAVTMYGYDRETGNFYYPPIMAGVWYPERAIVSPEVPRDHISFTILDYNQPYFVEDTSLDPLFKGRRFAIEEQIRSCVALPLRVGLEKVGVMFVNYRYLHRFTPDELTNVELFANQAAVAIRNAQLYRAEQNYSQKLKQRVKELSALNKISQTIGLLTDAKQVHQQVNESIAQLIGAEMCAVLLYENTTEELVCQVPVYGVEDRLASRYRLPIGPYSPAASIWQTQNHILLNNVLHNPLVAGLGLEQLTIEAGVRDTLLVNLKVGNRNIGVIQASNKQNGEEFNKDDVQLLSILAGQAAAVIENARLYKETQERAQQLAAIHRVALAANSTLDKSDILRKALSEMMDGFDLDQGSVILIAPEENYGIRPITIPGRNETQPLLIQLKDNSIFERILEHKQPLAIDGDLDVSLPINYMRETGRETALSVFLIPLVKGDQVRGIIELAATRTKREFTDQDIELAQTMVNQVATALENAQLYEQEQARVILLNTLYEASRTIVSSLDTDAVLNHIAKQAWYLTTSHGEKYSFASIRLLEQSKLKLAALYSQPFSLQDWQSVEPEVNLRPRRGRKIGIMGRAVNTGEPQLVGNAPNDPDYLEIHPAIRSVLAVPIKLGQVVVGVIQVEHSDYNAFNTEHQYTLVSLAAQAAINIQNAHLFKETQRHARLLAAAAKVARGATGTLKVDRLLNDVVHLVVNCFDFFYHAGVFLLDENRQYAVLRAASSEGGQRMLQLGHRLKVGEQGIVGFVTKMGRPRLTSNVRKDPHHFINLHLPDTRAEMAFPLIARGQVIGALDVQSKEVINLQEEDIATLQTMADQLANAIYNAQQYEELKRTKGLVGAQTALAWMGMVSAVWRHAIDGYAMTIKEELELLSADSPPEYFDKVGQRVEKVKRLSQLILDKPINPPLSEDEGVESVPVNYLLRERVRQLWENEAYYRVHCRFDFLLSDVVTVRSSPEWLRRVFDILIDNAITAMHAVPDPAIVLSTQYKNHQVSIIFADNGHGIPEAIKQQLFNEPVKKLKGAKGLGMGLLMAQTIVRAYGGEILLLSTDATGTKMEVLLPVETRTQALLSHQT